MSKQSIDTVLRIRLKHRPGQLAKVAAAIADEAALLGEIITVKRGEDDTVREITIEAASEEQTARVIEAVKRLDGVDVEGVRDRVFEWHQGGKIHSTSRVPLEHVRDLRVIYTPGVARVVRAIERDPQRAWDLTSIGHSVGIFTNGSRVLGLGDVGTLPSMPVMEGKAVLYDKLTGVSATPILVDTLDPEVFIETVMRMAGSFGGVHLEDIRSPDCYRIEGELSRRLEQPVFHDDQHGTATVALAAIINACKLTKQKLERARVGQIGLGAAGSAIVRLAMAYGVADVLVSDPSPAAVARVTAMGARAVDLPTLMREADIVVAATGRPGLVTPSSIRAGQVVFSLSNPEPEIDAKQAMAAGAAFASDGRSINNALAFPGIFRGALDVRSRAVTVEMLVDAAVTIAAHADGDEVVPSPLDLDVHRAVVAAVVARATAQGLAGTAKLAVTAR